MTYNDFDLKVLYNENNPFTVEAARRYCSLHPDKKILLNIENTVGIKSEDIRRLPSNACVRIAGAYNKDTIERYKRVVFEDERAEDLFTNSVIYTRAETFKIIQAMERIERGINPKWDDLQKTVYIYDALKRNIMYDPKYETRSSADVRSLRGLISKQTVCAGYALILKEMLDRQGIKCDYVHGDGHAWNVVTIDGKMYPFDLTWDNQKFRSGHDDEFNFLGQDPAIFNKYHKIDKRDPLYGQESKLSKISSDVIKRINAQFRTKRDFDSTTYVLPRNDGTRCVVSQVGNRKINGEEFYRYFVVELDKDGKQHDPPLLLYSYTNVAHYVDAKRFGEKTPPHYGDRVCNVLFSHENIMDSLRKNTYYIGGVRIKDNSNKLNLVSSVQEIDKPEDKRREFAYPIKNFTRSDGTNIVIQKYNDINVCNTDLHSYDIFEAVAHGGKNVVRKNHVFSETDLFSDSRHAVIDGLLSRQRLDRCADASFGYIGYCDASGKDYFNPDLVDYFDSSREFEYTASGEKKKSDVPNNMPSNIPSFEEAKKLVHQYEIYEDPNNMFDTNIKIVDKNTKQIVTDGNLSKKALFANMWLFAAGVKAFSNEQVEGEGYAFNSSAEELYNDLCSRFREDVRNNGSIDTVGAFKDAADNSTYKHSIDIVVGLFRSRYQTDFINEMFQDEYGGVKGANAEALYSISYAGDLAYNNRR